MPSTLLDYEIAVTPFPLIASPTSGGSNQAALNLIATNLTDAPISIQAIALTLWAGSDDTDLTDDTSSIQPQAPPNWAPNPAQYANGTAAFSFSPNDPSGSATVAPQASLTFTLSTITINQRPGTCNIVVTEGSGDCQPPGCPTVTLEVTKFPSDWSGAGSTVSFTANPPIVVANDPHSTTTLSWSGPAGPTYTIEYWTPQTGIVTTPALGHTGQYPSGSSGLALTQTTTFYLTVTDTVDEQIYSAQYPLPVTVEATQQLGITVTASSTAIGVLDTLTLSWETQLAEGCSLEVDEGSGSVALSAANNILNSCQVTSSDGVTLVFSAADGSALGSITLQGEPATATFRFTASSHLSNIQQTYAVELRSAEIADFRYILEGVGTPDPFYALYSSVELTAKAWIHYDAGRIELPVDGSPSNVLQPVDDGKTYKLFAQGFGAAVSATLAVPSLGGD